MIFVSYLSIINTLEAIEDINVEQNIPVFKEKKLLKEIRLKYGVK